VLLRPFYLNDVLVTPNLTQSLLSVHRFTTNNSCPIEFYPFGLSVKDLATTHVLASYHNTGLLYTLPLPASPWPTPHVACMPWLSPLPPLRGIAALVTLTLTSSLSCQVAQPSPALEAEMIPFVMHVTLVDVFSCLLLAHLPRLSDMLTTYTMSSGPPLFSMSLVTSIT
jgi:hypothetical protein